MRLPSALRVFAVLLFACVGSSSPPASGDPAPADLLEASVDQGDLRLTARVLPKGTRRRPLEVGTPLEVEVSITNLGAQTVSVPMDEMTDVHFRCERHYEGLTFGGLARGMGGGYRSSFAPYRTRLIEPGATVSMLRKGSPVFGGSGHLVVALRNNAATVRVGKTPVPEPKRLPLWVGDIGLRLPLDVTADGGNSPRGEEALGSLGNDWVARVAAMELIVADAPDQRSVRILSQYPARAGPRSRLHPMEWSVCLMHLLVAAQRGYGLDALSEHVAALADGSTPLEVQRWGLEGAALALRLGVSGFVPGRDGTWIDTYVEIEVEPTLRQKARQVVERLAAETAHPLQSRAAAILADPLTLPPQDPAPR